MVRGSGQSRRRSTINSTTPAHADGTAKPLGASLAFGAHSFIWTGDFTGTEEHIFAQAADLGFDGVEIATSRAAPLDPDRLARWSERYGLAATICATLPAGLSMASSDRAVRRETAAHLRAILERAHAIGLKQVVGPVLHPVGALSGAPPREAERSAMIESLKATADELEALGMRLALEPLNRFQGYLLNTVDQGLDLCERAGSPRIGLLLDLFHMNIEETDPCAAVRRAGPRCFHVHASACDRGAPGSDRFPWDDLRTSLAAIGYAGWMVIESFNFDDPIASKACLWRRVAPSSADLARDGLAHLRRVFEASAAKRKRDLA